jgi:TRAP-type C4-dicarboxylate transport system permease small subunit
VELVLVRLPSWGRSTLLVIFDLMSLTFALVLLWQTARLEIITWETSETAQSVLETPLWIPRLVMPIGAFVLCISLMRTAWKHARDAISALPAKGN